MQSADSFYPLKTRLVGSRNSFTGSCTEIRERSLKDLLLGFGEALPGVTPGVDVGEHALLGPPGLPKAQQMIGQEVNGTCWSTLGDDRQ